VAYVRGGASVQGGLVAGQLSLPSASVSSDLKALYKAFIIIIFLNPRKTRVGKKLKKLKRMERLMFRAVVQLKTIVQFLLLLFIIITIIILCCV